MSCTVPSFVLLWACFSAGGALAQQPAAFDEAFARFVAANPADRAAAARAAATAFLGLPAGGERSARLLEGAEALVAADRAALAIDVADEARSIGMDNGRLARITVAAAVRGGAFPAAMTTARKHVVGWPDEVRASLVADEAIVAPAAERAMRQGDVVNGRFAFEQLAAARPQAGYRVANFALCLRQLGEVDEARRQYGLALALAPADLEIENDFGLFLRSQGDVAGALAAFQRSWLLDLARGPESRARGPAVTNLVHLAAIGRDTGPGDVLSDASRALAVRPDAAMLRRLALDVAVDRAAAKR